MIFGRSQPVFKPHPVFYGDKQKASLFKSGHDTGQNLDHRLFVISRGWEKFLCIFQHPDQKNRIVGFFGKCQLIEISVNYINIFKTPTAEPGNFSSSKRAFNRIHMDVQFTQITGESAAAASQFQSVFNPFQV